MDSRERDPVDGEGPGRSEVADRNIEGLHRAIEIQADIGRQSDERIGGGGDNFEGDLSQPDAIPSRWWSIPPVRVKVVRAGKLNVAGRHGLIKGKTLPRNVVDYRIEDRIVGDGRSEASRALRVRCKLQTELAQPVGIGGGVTPHAHFRERKIVPQIENQNRRAGHREIVRRKTTRRTSDPESSRTTPRLVMRFRIRESRSRSLDQIGNRPEVASGRSCDAVDLMKVGRSSGRSGDDTEGHGNSRIY